MKVARAAAQFQSFSEYGLKGDHNNSQLSAILGNRFDSGAWLRLALNRQDSTSQPQRYLGINASATRVFAPPTGTPFTGVIYDVEPNGLRRAILGANAGAIDHTIQHTVKLRGGY